MYNEIWNLVTTIAGLTSYHEKDLFNREDRRNEVSEFWITSVPAGLSRAGVRRFCKLVDMPESRAYPACGCFLPASACTIAMQGVLFQAKGRCFAACIVGSKQYAELLLAQGSRVY